MLLFVEWTVSRWHPWLPAPVGGPAWCHPQQTWWRHGIPGQDHLQEQVPQCGTRWKQGKHHFVGFVGYLKSLLVLFWEAQWTVLLFLICVWSREILAWFKLASLHNFFLILILNTISWFHYQMWLNVPQSLVTMTLLNDMLISGWLQDCCIFIANALGIPQSCTKPYLYFWLLIIFTFPASGWRKCGVGRKSKRHETAPCGRPGRNGQNNVGVPTNEAGSQPIRCADGEPTSTEGYASSSGGGPPGTSDVQGRRRWWDHGYCQQQSRGVEGEFISFPSFSIIKPFDNVIFFSKILLKTAHSSPIISCVMGIWVPFQYKAIFFGIRIPIISHETLSLSWEFPCW